MKITSKNSLATDAREKVKAGNGGNIKMVDVISPVMGSRFAALSGDEKFRRADQAPSSMRTVENTLELTGKYGSGFDTPMTWSDGKTMTTRQMLAKGALMSSNTLPADWQNLWDAFRIDITKKGAENPTVRELIYNVTNNPAFSRTVNLSELNRPGIVFEKNNGHGQSIPQGESMGGAYDSIILDVYAAGWVQDLIGELFDQGNDPETLSEAVTLGYNGKRDDLAISPILNYVYSGDQLTAADATGSNRQELLYLTLENAIDDLGNREDPSTGNKLPTDNLLILASSRVAGHISRVAGGLNTSNERVYPELSELAQIVAYDGVTIQQRSREITYSGVGDTYAYLMVPKNRGMQLAVKRDLQVEVDLHPDVKTLAREERAYWFAEGICWNGCEYFIQKITLPEW